MALNWRDGLDNVAGDIASLFPRTASPEWHHDHPRDYIGPVWIRVLPSSPHRDKCHRLTLRWGRYLIDQSFTASDDGPVSFIHHRGEPDGATLHVSVTPPAIVTFGQGPAPDHSATTIDEGWTRSSGHDLFAMRQGGWSHEVGGGSIAAGAAEPTSEFSARVASLAPLLDALADKDAHLWRRWSNGWSDPSASLEGPEDGTRRLRTPSNRLRCAPSQSNHSNRPHRSYTLLPLPSAYSTGLSPSSR